MFTIHPHQRPSDNEDVWKHINQLVASGLIPAECPPWEEEEDYWRSYYDYEPGI